MSFGDGDDMQKGKSSESGARIVFPASVNQVRTMVDGGLRVVLDLPETAIPQAAMLMQCKVDGIPLVFTARAEA